MRTGRGRLFAKQRGRNSAFSQPMPASTTQLQTNASVSLQLKLQKRENYVNIFSGNLVTNGIEIMNNGGIQNAHFGIKKDGSLFTGYKTKHFM